jgi:hypothetical protein
MAEPPTRVVRAGTDLTALDRAVFLCKYAPVLPPLDSRRTMARTEGLNGRVSLVGTPFRPTRHFTSLRAGTEHLPITPLASRDQ